MIGNETRDENITRVLAEMRAAWKDYPDMNYRVIVEAWDPNVGRMDARYCEGYETLKEQAE